MKKKHSLKKSMQVNKQIGLKQRHNVLLNAYQNRNKVNEFLDLRLKSAEMQDEIALKKYAFEKKRQHAVVSHDRNDNKGDSLTHKGKLLSALSKLDDMASEDSDDDNDNDNFGNTKLFNVKKDSGGIKQQQSLSDIISRCKQIKYDKQFIKDGIEQEVEELNKAFLAGVVPAPIKSAATKSEKTRVVNDLGFQSLLSEVTTGGFIAPILIQKDNITMEIGKNQEQRLCDKLEQRLSSSNSKNVMMSFDDKVGHVKVTSAVGKHISADALSDDDDYELDANNPGSNTFEMQLVDYTATKATSNAVVHDHDVREYVVPNISDDNRRVIEILAVHNQYVRPVLTYLTHSIAQNKLRNVEEVISGMRNAHLLHQVLSSKTLFCPELISFLKSVLQLACHQKDVLTGEFSHVVNTSSELLLVTCTLQSDWLSSLQSLHLTEHDIEIEIHKSQDVNITIISCLISILQLLEKLSVSWNTMPAYNVIFQPLYDILYHTLSPIWIYPEILRNTCSRVMQSLLTSLQSHNKKCKMQFMKLPVMLNTKKLDYSNSFMDKKGHKSEKKRLSHRVKKEMKSVKREIRQDADFIAAHKLKITKKNDAERIRKVNLLRQEIAEQNGDIRKMKKHVRVKF